MPKGNTMVVPIARTHLCSLGPTSCTLSNFGPSRENKRAVLDPFGAPGSGIMGPKGAKAHDINMPQACTLCGTVLKANKLIWDDWASLRGQKRQKGPNLTHFGRFSELGYPM